jgi:hypothetical protein
MLKVSLQFVNKVSHDVFRPEGAIKMVYMFISLREREVIQRLYGFLLMFYGTPIDV